ncbi:MAG TPA: SDR family oxidoreductase [Ignavibacteriaceae bacterium]|nr:SDR family oxidoreductase [Ignavibacteriaceae bacterium]HPO56791.1 SDR family oxidoreductase [Ignavibacteriaceae bacterium]
MPPLKIFITGGSGLLGQYLNRELAKHAEILSLYNSHIGNTSNFGGVKVDIRNTEELKSIFDSFRPGITIHLAAVSNPVIRGAEYDKQVYDINVRATENIARLCDKYNSRLIYTSTDLVYAGYRGSMLKEDAKLIPVSLYAETKLMGEQKIIETFENYIILRTALLIGFGLNHSSSHFDSLFNNLKSGRESKLFTDQFRTPLSLQEAARIISELAVKDISGQIVNFGGLTRVSRFDVGEILCRLLKCSPALLIPAKMSDLPNYPAVADVSMDTSKLKDFGIFQKQLEVSISEIIAERE